MAHDALRSRCVARRWPLEAEGLGPGSGAPRGWDAPLKSVRLSVTRHNEVHAQDSHLWILVAHRERLCLLHREPAF